VQHGLDIAKLLALGCDLVSISGPLMRAAQESPTKLDTLLSQLVCELRLTMFGVGARNVDELKSGRRLRSNS